MTPEYLAMSMFEMIQGYEVGQRGRFNDYEVARYSMGYTVRDALGFAVHGLTPGQAVQIVYKGRVDFVPPTYDILKYASIKRSSIVTRESFRVTDRRTRRILGYIHRSYGYNAHSDYGARIIDSPHIFLGDNQLFDTSIRRLMDHE